MSDPYKVLGVSPTASDDEVKSAYRALAKKYHPDNYADSPLADLAGEKMKEINEAYDQITNERKHRRTGGYTQPGYSGSAEYLDVRNLIVANRITDAEQILDGVPPENRSAEWFFLKGTILYKRGWLNEAYDDFARACQMDPANGEYRAALNQINSQRSGMYGGYNPNVPMNGGCTGCDVCTSLCIADTCCNCFGGGMGPWC
jgi:curved DNA-binding protein CbpA